MTIAGRLNDLYDSFRAPQRPRDRPNRLAGRLTGPRGRFLDPRCPPDRPNRAAGRLLGLYGPFLDPPRPLSRPSRVDFRHRLAATRPAVPHLPTCTHQLVARSTNPSGRPNTDEHGRTR